VDGQLETPRAANNDNPAVAQAFWDTQRRAPSTGLHGSAVAFLRMPMLMPLKDARARDEQVWLARELGSQSWSRIAEQYGYSSVGGAQRAYTRYVARHPTPDPMAVLAGIIERTRTTNGIAMAELTKAVRDGDRPAIVGLIGAINRNDVALARVCGLGRETVTVDVNIQQTPAEIIESTRQRLLEIVDAEVVPQKEIRA
jgi:hypothetical protein